MSTLVRLVAEVIAEQFHGADSLLTLRCASGMELFARVATQANGGGFAFKAQDLVPLERMNRMNKCAGLVCLPGW